MIDTSLVRDITVPQRYRQDLGDLESLMTSMATIGLLHPIVITSGHRLIAGARRLEAAKQLHWETIPVRILDLTKLLHGEYDENEVRKDFTPTEKVAIGLAIEAEIAAENATRQREGRKKGGETGGRGRPKAETNGDSSQVNYPQAKAPKPATHYTRERAATKAGMAGKTYAKAKAVVEAAEANPDRYGDLPAKMDAENNVDGAYKAMQQRTRAAQRAQAALQAEAGRFLTNLQILLETEATFGCLYADPPWHFANTATRGAAAQHYPTMALAELMALPVAQLAAPQSYLHLWTPNALLPEGLQLMAAWGFTYKTNRCWHKDRLGTGNHVRNTHELLLIGTRGTLSALVHDVPSCISLPRECEHSAKPALFRDDAARMSPGPYLELFGRCPVPGWVVWGNECLEDAGGRP